MNKIEQKLQVTPVDLIAGKTLLAVLEEKSAGDLISRQEVLDIAKRLSSGTVISDQKDFIESFESQSREVLEHTECAGACIYRVVGSPETADTVTGGNQGTVIKISGLDPFKKLETREKRGEIVFPSVLTLSRALVFIKYVRENGGGIKNELSSYTLGKYYRTAGIDKPTVRTIISGFPAVGYVEEMRILFDRLLGKPGAIEYSSDNKSRRNRFFARIGELDMIEKKIRSLLGESDMSSDSGDDLREDKDSSDTILLPENPGKVLPVSVRIKRSQENLEKSFPNIKFEVNLELGESDFIYDITVEANNEAETDAVFLFRSLREEDGEKVFNNIGESHSLVRVFNRVKVVNKLIY